MRVLDEQMSNTEVFYFTYKYSLCSKILLQIKNWTDQLDNVKDILKVTEGYVCSSDTNLCWMSPRNFQAWINANAYNIGKNLIQ